MTEKSNKRVVVTGMGTVNPLGLTVDEYWNSMIEGKSGCDFIKSFDSSRIKTKFACEINGFDAGNYMDKKAARRMDTYAQYAMAASVQAINDSGIKTDTLTDYEK